MRGSTFWRPVTDLFEADSEANARLKASCASKAKTTSCRMGTCCTYSTRGNSQPLDAGTISPKAPSSPRWKPKTTLSRNQIRLRNEGFWTTTAAGGSVSWYSFRKTLIPPCCQAIRTGVKSGAKFVVPWTTTTLLIPCSIRKAAERKSVMKQTERLSNMPGTMSVFAILRSESSRNAGGEFNGNLSLPRVVDSRIRAPRIGSTCTVEVSLELGSPSLSPIANGNALYRGTGRYPSSAIRMPQRMPASSGRSTTKAVEPVLGTHSF